MAMIGRPAPPSRLSTGDIADNAITSAKIAQDVITHSDLAPNSVTNSEMADDAVGIAELSATGTPNATSFLRGDNSWQVVDTEGTGIKSTGESGGNKFLREDGDGTSSWQVAGSPSITDNGNATALTIDSDEALTVNGSFKQLSNRNLSGTYSSHELFIADGYTLTGNITVNENIALTKLSDDGTSITLTTDGTSRTITGSGTIESSTIAQTPVTSVSGMTGELGTGASLSSAVTGSPSLNLTNCTFPDGHVIKSYAGSSTNSLSAQSAGWTEFVTTDAVTPTYSTSKFIVHFNFQMGWTQITDGGWNLRIIEDNSSTMIYETNTAYHKNGGTILHYMYGLQGDARGGVYQNTNTSSRVFSVDINPSGLTGNEHVTMNVYGKTFWWWILEVK